MRGCLILSYVASVMLGLFLVALKAVGLLNVEWVWVMSPFWGPPALLVTCVLAVFAMIFLAGLCVMIFAFFADVTQPKVFL